MYEIFATLLTIVIFGGMGYGIYQHYVSPFKTISNAKKIKEASNKIEQILTDEIFKKRIEPVNIALKEGKLTQEKYEIIFKELVLERHNELYNNSTNSNTVISNNNSNSANNNMTLNNINNINQQSHQTQENIKKESNSNLIKNNSNNSQYKPITIIFFILIILILFILYIINIGNMFYDAQTKLKNESVNRVPPPTTTTTTNITTKNSTTTTTSTTTKKITTTTKPITTKAPTTTQPTTAPPPTTTTTTTTTTQPATQPITNIKSKLIEELEFEGYKKDSNNENYYTLINEYPINIEGVPTLCIFVTSFNLRHYSYGYTLQCYQNNIMFYEQHTDYYSKTNKSSFKSLTSLEEIFDTTLAEIDNNNVFTCEGTNCEHGKQSMEQNKNNFITILNNANITQEELN